MTIKAKELAPLTEIQNDDLPKLFKDFYADAHTRNKELYNASTIKSMRSNMNRWFKENRKIDIITDPRFMEANSMFKGMQVKAKKQGKGVQKSTKMISPEDLAKIREYFDHSYIASPDPYRLQQCVMFNILYFFCWHGKENLHEMTKDHFEAVVQYDRTRFVHQVIDELDKNHRESSTEKVNQAKMYATPGNSSFLNFLASKNKQKSNLYYI